MKQRFGALCVLAALVAAAPSFAQRIAAPIGRLAPAPGSVTSLPSLSAPLFSPAAGAHGVLPVHSPTVTGGLPSISPQSVRFAAPKNLQLPAASVRQAAPKPLSVPKGFKSLPAKMRKAAGIAGKTLELNALFDGSGALPEGSFSPGAVGAAQDVANAYALYSWLSDLPELQAAGENSALAAARILIEAAPLLEKGGVFAMKEGESLTILSQKDAALAPVSVSLAADVLKSGEASYPARHLARELEGAEARDAADGTFVNKAEVLNRLPAIARSVEPSAPEKPAVLVDEEIPLDPRREPEAFLARRLRDAMREEDPYAALKVMETARREARERLDYGAGSRFLERLRAQGELMARGFVPRLIEEMRQAAGRADAEGVERAARAAYAYAEYAPNWKKRAQKVHEEARGVLALIAEYGLPDEKTGLPEAAAELAPQAEAAPKVQSIGLLPQGDSKEELAFAAKASFDFGRLADDIGAEHGRKSGQMTTRDFVDLLNETRGHYALQYKALAPSPQAYKTAVAVVDQVVRIVTSLLTMDEPLNNHVRKVLAVWTVFNQAMQEAAQKGTLAAIEAEARLFAEQVRQSVGQPEVLKETGNGLVLTPDIEAGLQALRDASHPMEADVAEIIRRMSNHHPELPLDVERVFLVKDAALLESLGLPMNAAGAARILTDGKREAKVVILVAIKPLPMDEFVEFAIHEAIHLMDDGILRLDKDQAVLHWLAEGYTQLRAHEMGQESLKRFGRPGGKNGAYAQEVKLVRSFISRYGSDALKDLVRNGSDKELRRTLEARWDYVERLAALNDKRMSTREKLLDALYAVFMSPEFGEEQYRYLLDRFNLA